MKGNKNSNLNLNPNHLVIENPHYSITRIENYRPKIQSSIQDILTKFVSSITEYLLLVNEKINMKNYECFVFIIERGIETIMHVFSIILYYTKNLDLAFYHSQKAYYFYIEFIEQISDDNVSFLQLSSRDATTFVYKKTLYEINNEHKKNMNELTNDEKTLIMYVDTYIYIYKHIIHFYISNKINLQTCCNKLLTIHNLDLNKNKIRQPYLECIYLFTKMVAYKQTVYQELDKEKEKEKENIIEDFIRLILSKKKKLIDDTIIQQNIHYYFEYPNDITLEQILLNVYNLN